MAGLRKGFAGNGCYAPRNTHPTGRQRAAKRPENWALRPVDGHEKASSPHQALNLRASPEFLGRATVPERNAQVWGLVLSSIPAGRAPTPGAPKVLCFPISSPRISAFPERSMTGSWLCFISYKLGPHRNLVGN